MTKSKNIHTCDICKTQIDINLEKYGDVTIREFTPDEFFTTKREERFTCSRCTNYAFKALVESLENPKTRGIDFIQYRHDTLEEVLEFTGKHEKFDEWFPTWEDYVTYVQNHNYIFKLFTPRKTYDVKLGDVIFRNALGEFQVFTNVDYLNPHLR